MADAELLKKVASDVIDSQAEDLFNLSNYLWENPELSSQEYKAHDFLTAFFERQGFAVERKHVLETGFRCLLDHGEGACVAVLCEYDALPGIGHACGHNLIAEAGAGAALGIKAAMETAKAQGKQLGKLYVVGTPAEETGNGKGEMVRGGTFTDIDLAMMVHPAPFTVSRVDSAFLACGGVDVTYHGKASHAAAFPWEGVNALDAAVMAYTSISVLRQQLKPTWSVHGIITNGGAKPNIIPEEASLEYYIRAPTMKEVKELETKVTPCFQAAALATGCTVDLNMHEASFNVVGNVPLLELYENNARALGVTFSDEMFKVSTDMGNLTHALPGIHPCYSINTTAGNHQKEFTVATGSQDAQPKTLEQAKAMAMTAIDIFCDTENILPKIKQAFQQDIDREGKYT